MPKLAIDVGTILLLILPGFLAYRFSVMQRADPSHRSAIWQVSEILEHSLYVHLSGIVLAFTVHLILGSTTHIAELLKQGPQSFLNMYFAEAIRWYIGYAIYIVLASEIIGAYNVPSRVSVSIVDLLSISKRFWLLKWLPVPGFMHHQESIWYLAFRVMPESRTNDPDPNNAEGNPLLFIRLKDSGDVYVGRIASYPIVPDVQAEKDFLITDTVYYRYGDFDDELDLKAIDGVGAVLLNSGNVESIRVSYD